PRPRREMRPDYTRSLRQENPARQRRHPPATMSRGRLRCPTASGTPAPSGRGRSRATRAIAPFDRLASDLRMPEKSEQIRNLRCLYFKKKISASFLFTFPKPPEPPSSNFFAAKVGKSHFLTAARANLLLTRY